LSLFYGIFDFNEELFCFRKDEFYFSPQNFKIFNFAFNFKKKNSKKKIHHSQTFHKLNDLFTTTNHSKLKTK